MKKIMMLLSACVLSLCISVPSYAYDKDYWYGHPGYWSTPNEPCYVIDTYEEGYQIDFSVPDNGTPKNKIQLYVLNRIDAQYEAGLKWGFPFRGVGCDFSNVNSDAGYWDDAGYHFSDDAWVWQSENPNSFTPIEKQVINLTALTDCKSLHEGALAYVKDEGMVPEEYEVCLFEFSIENGGYIFENALNPYTMEWPTEEEVNPCIFDGEVPCETNARIDLNGDGTITRLYTYTTYQPSYDRNDYGVTDDDYKALLHEFAVQNEEYLATNPGLTVSINGVAENDNETGETIQGEDETALRPEMPEPVYNTPTKEKEVKSVQETVVEEDTGRVLGMPLLSWILIGCVVVVAGVVIAIVVKKK